MNIKHVKARDNSTIVKAIRSTTAGLTSGYQKTGTTTITASAVATAGGYVIIGPSNLPWYSPEVANKSVLPITEELLDVEQDDLAYGYKAMADENILIAEKSLPLALEVLPSWEE